MFCESDLYHHTKQSLVRKILSDSLFGENDPQPQNKRPTAPVYYYLDGAVNKKGRLGNGYFFPLGETLVLEPFYIMFLAVLYVIMLAGLSVVQLVCLSVGQLVNNEFQGIITVFQYVHI